jgi:hypothetical protein
MSPAARQALTLFALLPLVVEPVPAAAQVRAPEVSLSIGPSFSALDGMDGFYQEETRYRSTVGRRAGASAGLEINLPLWNAFSLGVGAGLIRKGGKVEVLQRGGSGVLVVEGSAKMETTHLDLPLLLRANAPGTPGLFFYGGTFVSFELRCRASFELHSSFFSLDVSESERCDGREELAERRTGDVGGVFGGGLTFPAGPLKVFLDARYTHGLRDVALREDGTALRSRSTTLSTGISLPLRR